MDIRFALPLAAALLTGCSLLQKQHPGQLHGGYIEECEPEVVRVKAPRQKVYVERVHEAEKADDDRETDRPRPESAPTDDRRPLPESEPYRRPEAAANEFGVSDAMAIASGVSQLAAMTQPLTSVDPGASALGVGVTWIHIPIPLPRLFKVQESPSVRIPLTSQNIMTHPAMLQQQMMAGGMRTQEEIAQAVRETILAERQAEQAARQRHSEQEAARKEKEQLQQELRMAAERVERLTDIVEQLKEQSEGLDVENVGAP